MTNNQRRYPEIVQEPKKVTVRGNDYMVYKFRFKGLNDLYNYLKSNPEINNESYGASDDVASITGDEDFAGIPYDEAVEQLVNYNDPKYKEFLTLSTKTKVKNLKTSATFKPINSVAGGIIRPAAFAIGDPHIYRTTKIIKSDVKVNIHTITNYLGGTSKNQVYNKAIVLTNVIHALEQRGLKVNVNAFSASEHDGEIIDVDLNIKGNNSGTNYQALYRALCNVEFLRRIIFRVRETADVETVWRHSYGRTLDQDFAKEYLNISKDDIYFGTPDELDIEGYDIADDFENAVYNLHLEDKIDVERAKIKVKQSFKK